MAESADPLGSVKVQRTVIAEMPAANGKRPAFWLKLRSDAWAHQERLYVSASEYRRYRVLDIVEVHSRPGVLGYGYVRDVVRIGSLRLGAAE